jgi:hypothetical protein
MFFMRRNWLPIITLTAAAVMISVALSHSQEAVIVTTSASHTTYPIGAFEDELPTPKPNGVNMLRGVIDRQDFLDPASRIEWSIWYSMNGGQSYRRWAAAATIGGDFTRFGIFASSFEVAAPPEGSLILNKTSITGAPATLGTVLQMWEAR